MCTHVSTHTLSASEYSTETIQLDQTPYHYITTEVALSTRKLPKKSITIPYIPLLLGKNTQTCLAYQETQKSDEHCIEQNVRTDVAHYALSYSVLLLNI